ncbi:OLC1v1010019C1 [Oldenlandia corymbosa var. corymbosa]|uniref:OLC1v1010019C1 n=1 Tax=Oldenlandia corymbosa var. corymbosa TaxID=529605 RepID=A0AAV1DRW5_OLDCO|nr:OLC1v1010019C1 [Oldenlandia corymbosa var. corymbosa]
MQLTDFHTQLSRDNLQLSLLGYLIEDFEVDDRVMQDYMVANWPVIARVLHYDHNFFILKFMNRAEMMAILDNGPYAVNEHLGLPAWCAYHFHELSLLRKSSKKKRSTRLPDYKVAAMLDFYDSVPDTFIQDGFTISETDEETPVPWYPWSPHNPDDHQSDDADEKDDGNQSDDVDQDDINPDNNDNDDDFSSGGSDQFMDEINADNFVDDDGPPIPVEGRTSLYAGVEVDYSRSAAPAAGEDTNSSFSTDQSESFHSFSSYSSEFYQHSVHSFPDDASEFCMPNSFYEILDVPPSDAMMENPSYVPDFIIPTGSDYPPHRDISLVSCFSGFQFSDDSHDATTDEAASDSVYVNSGVRMNLRLSTRYSAGGGGFQQHRRIPVNAKGRGNFKKKDSRGSSSSDSALPSLLDEFSQTDSDPGEFFMKARMAVSDSDLPDSVHTVQQSSPNRPAAPGWRMKIVDEDFDESIGFGTSLNSTCSKKRHSEDSLPDLEHSEKRRSNTVMHEEVQNLFKDLEMAWEEGKQHATAPTHLNGFAGIEPDQSPLS